MTSAHHPQASGHCFYHTFFPPTLNPAVGHFSPPFHMRLTPSETCPKSIHCPLALTCTVCLLNLPPHYNTSGPHHLWSFYVEREIYMSIGPVDNGLFICVALNPSPLWSWGMFSGPSLWGQWSVIRSGTVVLKAVWSTVKVYWSKSFLNVLAGRGWSEAKVLTLGAVIKVRSDCTKAQKKMRSILFNRVYCSLLPSGRCVEALTVLKCV